MRTGPTSPTVLDVCLWEQHCLQKQPSGAREQHIAAREKARVCRTEVHEVFTKLSASFQPEHLPQPCKLVVTPEKQ